MVLPVRLVPNGSGSQDPQAWKCTAHHYGDHQPGHLTLGAPSQGPLGSQTEASDPGLGCFQSSGLTSRLVVKTFNVLDYYLDLEKNIRKQMRAENIK